MAPLSRGFSVGTSQESWEIYGSRRAFYYRFLPIFQTFLGDFDPQQLPSRRLQTLWEWKNRVILEEYYIFDAVIPLEVE